MIAATVLQWHVEPVWAVSLLKDRELHLRVISSLVMIPIALGSLFHSNWLLHVLVAVAVVALSVELGMMGQTASKKRVAIAIAASVLVAVALDLAYGNLWGWIGLCTMSLAVSLGMLVSGSPYKRSLLSSFYIGAPMMCLFYLRNLPEDGLIAILVTLLLVWTTDIAAYFFGRRFGKRKLAPNISPGKTWAGLVGGVTCAVVLSLLLTLITPSPRLFLAVVLGLVVALVSQFGDLFESWLKRRVGIKDSGHLIPGHGGVLDRVDGLLFTFPVVALFFVIFGDGALPWN